jgi:hypothetical protein
MVSPVMLRGADVANFPGDDCDVFRQAISRGKLASDPGLLREVKSIDSLFIPTAKSKVFITPMKRFTIRMNVFTLRQKAQHA